MKIVILNLIAIVGFQALVQQNVLAQAPAAQLPPAPAAFSCKSFANAVAKRNYSCKIVGRYKSFDINQDGASASFSIERGQAWSHGGKRGAELSVNLIMGSYTVDLMKLDVAPLAAQGGSQTQVSVTENCTAESMKVATKERESGEAWGAIEHVEIKRSLAKPAFLQVLINKSDLRLRLNCK